MTEERLEPAESQNRAVHIVHILIHFTPKDPSGLATWFEQIEFLQNLLSKSWQDDKSGKVMVECLTVLYDVIALNQSPVSPAVWSVLELVEEEKIHDIVEGILNDPNKNEDSKVQNALIAIIEGLCMYGPRARRLQDWALAIIQGLEMRKNFEILISVAECTIVTLISRLLIPLFRPLVYPFLRLFLYSVPTPDVFYKIVDHVPPVVTEFKKEIDNEETKHYLTDFLGLLKELLQRYPTKPSLEAKYSAINKLVTWCYEEPFKPDSLILWDLDKSRIHDWTLQPASYDFDAPLHMPYKGLINLGNTCFMNSVLQILFMTTRFRSDILLKETDPSERAAIDLQQLFAFMQESNRPVLVPNGVLDSTLPPTFRGGHQQDSSEYLIYLLDTLHENENKIIRRNRQSNSPQKNSSGKKMDGNGDFEEGAATSVKQQSDDSENTIVERLFGGVTTSTTVCSFCNRSFPKNDSFRDLHLSLPDDYKSCDLQELINVSLQPEELCSDNMYDCSSCGTKRNATRTQTIIKAPEHLILTLKLFRFDPVRKQRLKLHSRLKSAKTIELPVYNSSQLETKVVMYDIKGVVLHSGGSLDGGHYFSSAVDPSGQWYIFNDSVVSVAKCEWSGSGGTPYILVLRQSNLNDPPKRALPNNLQLLVNRDNQKYSADRRYRNRMPEKRRDYDDDYDDMPPSNGSLGGPGPPLVF
ncbi:UNVERIFIED_CONTAM: hypothetical protein PYX00_009111 [Menopon gallinae]|uniref:USP domain-containing protein n=1 Tax=Menopon gallinae TaxID=328185 RepID=A0AAW2H9W2_9NEOP